jgi:PAS domain S-box-containing protein
MGLVVFARNVNQLYKAMGSHSRSRPRRQKGLLLVGVAVGIVGILALDVLTPLGIVVWILYLVPLSASLYLWRPSMPIVLASACSIGLVTGYFLSPSPSQNHAPSLYILNRGMGAVALWAVAVVARQLILKRQSLLARQRDLSESEERFRLLVARVRDYAIFMLDPGGHIASWNLGAERLKGYTAGEIIGRHFSVFYTPEAIQTSHPQRELELAVQQGSYSEEGWRVRKDGTRFWASVVITALHDAKGVLRGFGKVTRDMTERKRTEDEILKMSADLERRVRDRTAELEAVNKELESFSYSVSHDLRAPLRGIDGFSKILLQKYGASLDEKGRHYLNRIRTGTQRMGQLIDDLIRLSRIARAELKRVPLDVGALARDISEDLRKGDPQRDVDLVIAQPAPTTGDPELLRIALENLLGNAWKFTSKTERARIELGVAPRDGQQAFYVRDNGAGFEMEYAGKLFAPFQRLHDAAEFEGTGIGLATAQRIIIRHGGRMWAEGKTNEGATFWFTLGEGAAQ